MKTLVLLVMLIVVSKFYAQGETEKKSEKIYFSQQVAVSNINILFEPKHLVAKDEFMIAEKKYNQLIEQKLEGSYIDDLSFSCLNTSKSSINEFSNPIILVTYATWNIPGKGEIQAINSFAAKYKDQIDFIILFWDNRMNAREAASGINDDIHIVYVYEKWHKHNNTIRMLKHSLGFPKLFSIASDKRILKIKNMKGLPFHMDLEKAIEINRKFFNNLISNINDYEIKVN